MVGLRIRKPVQAFSISNRSSRFVEEENEADFDLQLYFNHIEQSTTRAGELDFDLLSTIYELCSSDPEKQFAALVQLPKLYNFKNEDINEQIVPTLVDYLRRTDQPQLQINAARMLRYLGKKNIFILIETEAAPEFVKLLESPNEDLQQQAIWVLPHLVDANMLCSDGISLNEKLFFNLQTYFHHRPKAQFSLFQDALFLMLKILQREPIDKTIEFLEFLKPLLEVEEDEEMLKQVCTAVLQYSEGSNGRREAIEQIGIYPKLVKLLFHSCPDVLRSVMKTIANIARIGIYDDILSNRVLSRILVILSMEEISYTELHIQVCRIISLISEGTQDEIDLLIRANLFRSLVGFLIAEGRIDVKREAAYAICTAICGGNEDQVEYFVDLGCLELLGDLLTPQDAVLTRSCLHGIETMLKVAIGSHKYTNLFHSTQIRSRIYGLNEFHNSWVSYLEEIYIQGERICKTYLEPWPDSGDNAKKSYILVCDNAKKTDILVCDNAKKFDMLVCDDYYSDWEDANSECEDNEDILDSPGKFSLKRCKLNGVDES